MVCVSLSRDWFSDEAMLGVCLVGLIPLLTNAVLVDNWFAGSLDVPDLLFWVVVMGD